MKSSLLFLFFLLVYFKVFAQDFSQQTIAAFGETSQSNGIQLQSTLGEIAGESIYTKSGIFTQGFNQPSGKKITITQPIVEAAAITVVPNPFGNTLKVTLRGGKEKNVWVTIFDITGRNLFNKVFALVDESLYINTTAYLPGIYILQVGNTSSRLIKNFKLIKN